MSRILLIEDSAAISQPLSFLLRREGYTVDVVDDGAQAVPTFEQTSPDLILLDLMLPNVPGIEICRQVRAQSSVPILMLTAKNSETDIVVGLEAGADDYVTKPYSSGELMARIRAALRRQRRGKPQEEASHLEANGITVDLDSHEVTVDGTQVYLPLKEFELLSFLLANAGRVLPRGRLLDQVWGSDYYGDSKTLDVHIKRVRAKIEPDPKHPRRIVTVRGLGYKFEESEPGKVA